MCVFCQASNQRIYENDLVYAIYDGYPVSKGHILIIPKAHKRNYFEASEAEVHAINEALHAMKHFLDEQYSPDGYNIGINNGETAGQTIFHLHVHLIPRYKNDMDNPRGGVRGVIPNKRIY